MFRMLTLCFFPAVVAFAQGPGAATDLVGRNGEFVVKDKSGKVETVESKQLNLPSELLSSAPRGSIEDASSGDVKKDKTAGTKDTGAKKGVVAKAQKAVPKEETPEQKAVRAADVEELRAMRKQGGAYFYTEDDQPVSFEEIDRRIESGEVEGLKAVGLHLEDWKPVTKSKAGARSESESPATQSQEPAPKAIKKY